MHKTRWITGVCLVPPLIFLIYMGGVYFTALVGIAAVIGMWEFSRILSSAVKEDPPKSFDALSLFGYGTGFLLVWVTHKYSAELAACVLALNLLLCGAYGVFRFQDDLDILNRAARQVLTVCYIPFFLSFAVLIRDGADGITWILLVLAVIFAGDVGALYAGTFFGKHKLCPSVSPGKTIEGALGGVASNLLIGSAIKVLFLPRLIWTESLIFFVCIGLSGQLGDLFESTFKRVSGMKDSGTILPGHGGILDRIDALLFALPVAYYFKKFVLWV